MLITVEILKRVNGSIATGTPMSLHDLIPECALDEAVLKEAMGNLDKPVSSMSVFFEAMIAYVDEVQKRVKVMSECYNAIQKLQMKYSLIEATSDLPDPPIVWKE